MTTSYVVTALALCAIVLVLVIAVALDDPDTVDHDPWDDGDEK